MAKALEKVTEGAQVESTEIIEPLRETGVDYAQGYRFGAPHPMDKAFLKHPAQDEESVGPD